MPFEILAPLLELSPSPKCKINCDWIKYSTNIQIEILYSPVKVADEKFDFLITESEIVKPKFKIDNTNLAMIILQS